jgi:hypothetical protein
MDTAIVLETRNDFLVPAASLEQVLATYQLKKSFIEQVLKDGVDYGATPGTNDKPSLKKPGAEKMATFFSLAPTFTDIEKVEDWMGTEHNGEPFFYYRQKCTLYRGERMIASADGSCNSWEKKYRYRNSERICPNCGKSTIIKGKAEYGGGFICFAKKGGCGAKFQDNDPQIVGQEVGQVKNPDVAELVNTILKMAQKRALVAAVLIATNASDYFTQDLDDFVTGEIIDGTVRPSAPAPQPPAPETINQETGEAVPPVQMYGYLSGEVVAAVSVVTKYSKPDVCSHLAEAYRSGKIGKSLTIAEAEDFARKLIEPK